LPPVAQPAALFDRAALADVRKTPLFVIGAHQAVIRGEFAHD
jgi:hypothetical protein